jgi:hypothetical protein
MQGKLTVDTVGVVKTSWLLALGKSSIGIHACRYFNLENKFNKLAKFRVFPVGSK